MTTARSPSKRPVTNWASIPPSGFERLAEKARAFEAVAPRLLDRLGETDAGAGDNLDFARPREQRKGWLVEGQAVVRPGYPQRLADPAGAGAKQPLIGNAAPAAHDR